VIVVCLGLTLAISGCGAAACRASCSQHAAVDAGASGG